MRGADETIGAPEVDQKSNAGPTIAEGRGGIQVVTQNNPSKELITDMGVDRIVLASLLGSNEGLPIGILIRWEEVLDIKGQLVSKKELDKTYKGLLEHQGV